MLNKFSYEIFIIRHETRLPKDEADRIFTHTDLYGTHYMPIRQILYFGDQIVKLHELLFDFLSDGFRVDEILDYLVSFLGPYVGISQIFLIEQHEFKMILKLARN